jgi:hypothetical protein
VRTRVTRISRTIETKASRRTSSVMGSVALTTGPAPA